MIRKSDADFLRSISCDDPERLSRIADEFEKLIQSQKDIRQLMIDNDRDIRPGELMDVMHECGWPTGMEP